jgi:hypothetical protein
MFPVGRDADGLKQALRELMEEGFAYHRIAGRVDGADDEQRMRAMGLPERTLTPGYYKLGEYLLWLAQRLDVKVPAPAKLLALEGDGLAILAEARAEFEHEHPVCGACGERQDGRLVLGCHACGIEFKRAA